MKLTKKEAKRLSILKWEFIIKNGGDYEIYELPEELQELDANCGYCEKYHNDCPTCPIGLNSSFGCTSYNHPWDNWYDNRTVKNAQAMLDLIRKT